MIRFCLKSLPAIGYRRLIFENFQPRNPVWYENTFTCCFRGFFCRFKSTRSGMFKALNGPNEDIKISDTKSSKLEEGKGPLKKNNPTKMHLERLNVSKIKPITIDPGIAAPRIKINEKVAIKKVEHHQPEVLRELSDKVEKIKINEIKKSEDPFAQFQQLLTIPNSDQKSSSKNKDPSEKKKSAGKSLVGGRGKFIPQHLARNKTDPKLYENLTLLKDPEPQCEFLELQSGRKRIAIVGGLSDVNQTNLKPNLTSSRTMTTSQAENKGHAPQKSAKKKSILPTDRLEKKLLLETPKIKAIKNRLSKMDRYWILKKPKTEAKIPDSLLRLKDRICQQIEASKNFKYEAEPLRLAVVENEEFGGRNVERFSRDRPDAVSSSENVLKRVKIMNRKLKTEPYIPPIVNKKPLMKKSSSGKLILKKMNKKERKAAVKAFEVEKKKDPPPEKQEKLYSDKIRAKIMQMSEKHKKEKKVESVVQAETQDGPDGLYTPLETKTDANPPEIVTATPSEIPAPASAPEPQNPKNPEPEPKKPENPPRPPRLNFPKINFPKPNSWNIRPRPSPPAEETQNLRKLEPKPAMTLDSAMEGFKTDSAVNRLILQAKARAMGVKSEEIEAAPKEPKETFGKKKKKLKKIEPVRRSSFFQRKKTSKKPKENILSVDKADEPEIQEVTKRSRVPIKIPENVLDNNPVDTAKNPPPTQEQVAKKIRQWYIQDRVGEIPNPVAESPVPTLEKARPDGLSWPVEHEKKKNERSKVEEFKSKVPSPKEEIKGADRNVQSVSTGPVSQVAEPTQNEETRKADVDKAAAQEISEPDLSQSRDQEIHEPNAPASQAISEPTTNPVMSASVPSDPPSSPTVTVSESSAFDSSQSPGTETSRSSAPERRTEPKKDKKNYCVWVPSDPIFQKKLDEEFQLKRPKLETKVQNQRKFESVFKRAAVKKAAAQMQVIEARKSEMKIKKEKFDPRYDTRVGSPTVRKDSMQLYEKPAMVLKKSEKSKKSKKIAEPPREEIKLQPVPVPVPEEPLVVQKQEVVYEPIAPAIEEPLQVVKTTELPVQAVKFDPATAPAPVAEESPKFAAQPEEPVTLDELPEAQKPEKLVMAEEPEPTPWEEPSKLKDMQLEPAATAFSTNPEVNFDDIAPTIQDITSRAFKEDSPLKGAINIKLKPLSEIENLTKAVREYEKRVDPSGIDVFEEIISKKIETIPCAKPKLPPYYYTPYSSSTVEPEELPNKKGDKTDEK